MYYKYFNDNSLSVAIEKYKHLPNAKGVSREQIELAREVKEITGLQTVHLCLLFCLLEEIREIAERFKATAIQYNEDHVEELKPFFEQQAKEKADYEMLLKARKEREKQEKALVKMIAKAEEDVIKCRKEYDKKRKERDIALGIAGNSHYY